MLAISHVIETSLYLVSNNLVSVIYRIQKDVHCVIGNIKDIICSCPDMSSICLHKTLFIFEKSNTFEI